MATTTNYGWTTPDNTALVKDGASAIRTLGSSIDTSVKSLSPGTTAGDIDYYTSSTAKSRVAIGTTGQILTVSGGVPTWATPAGGGGLTLLSTTTLSGASVTVSSISGAYKNLQIVVRGATIDGSAKLLIQANASATLSETGFWDTAAGASGTFATGQVHFDNEASGILRSAILLLTNYADTSYAKTGSFVYNYGASGNTNSAFGGYHYASTSAISSIKIAHTNTGGAVFTGGQVLIYGVN